MKGAVSFDTAFTHPIEPKPSDFDVLGHVNNAVYLKWAQQISVLHWSSIATDEMKKRFMWVIVRSEIDYRDPILPGEGVLARTWLGEMKGARFDRYVDIRRPAAARSSASVRSTWVMLDAESRRPRRIGREILAAFGVG